MLSWSAPVLAGGCVALAASCAVAYRLALRLRLSLARRRWSRVQEDVVVLHQIARPGVGTGRAALSISPFPPKLEAWMRAVGIRYVSDFTHPFSPETGKTPWITVNGEEVSDSHNIMRTLMQRGLGRDLDSDLSPKEKGISRSFRILLEDHFFWAFAIERTVIYKAWYLRDVLRMPSGRPMPLPAFLFVRRNMINTIRYQAHAQGLLRLGETQAQKSGVEDLEALSEYLGSNAFIMGRDSPTDLDCTVFGFVHLSLLTAHPDSEYTKALKTKCSNLQQHFNRMKALLFPDWPDIMNGKEGTLEDFAKKDVAKEE